MNVLDLPDRPPSCLSDLTLDRLIAGELNGRPEGETAVAHLDGCARCRARKLEIQAVPAQLPGPELRRALARDPARKRRRPLVAALSLAAAAAIALAAGLRSTSHPDLAGGTRLKGGDLGFELLVKRPGGRAETVLPDVPLHPGDVLGFRLRTRAGGHLAIVSIDAEGLVSSYVPGPAGEMPDLAPGERVVDRGVSLDAVLGRETVFAVVCADQADAMRATAAAAAALGRAGSPAGVARLDLPCDQARAVLVKERTR